MLWLTTRYVSLGSVSAAAVFPVMTHLVFGDAFATAFSVLIAALVLFAHRENIKRLLNGTENKVPLPRQRTEIGGRGMNIVVLGSGGWGTALAMLLEQNQHTVTLWSHDPQRQSS